MSEWQPIATAPKEPLDYLSRGPTMLMTLRYSDSDKVHAVHWNNRPRCKAWYADSIRLGGIPIAWMPMPPPAKNFCPTDRENLITPTQD